MVSASRRLSFFVGRVDFGCGAYQGNWYSQICCSVVKQKVLARAW